MLQLVGALLLFLYGCQPEKTETTTKGHLHVLIAESIAPAMIQEIDEFHSIYAKNGANVTYSITSSDEAIRQFVQDTIRTIITTRPLTQQERDALTSYQEGITEIRIAYDALVVVVHHKNPVDQITTTDLRGILTGTITRWEQLARSKGARGRIETILQDSSDVTMYLQSRILRGDTIHANWKRTASSLQTLKAVVESPLALGIVGLDWLDSARVPAKVLEIAELNEKADTTFPAPIETIGKFYNPHPANIYRSYYPLKRAIYFYAKARMGTLVSGFGSYVSNKDGQEIFLKRHLVPGTQPIRLKSSE